MNHIIKILLSLFVLISSQINAQKIKFGIIGGASFANFINHNASGAQYGTLTVTSIQHPELAMTVPQYNPIYTTSFKDDMKAGSYGGIFLDIKLKDRSAIETGVTFTQKGINLNYSFSTSTENYGGAVTKEDRHCKRNVTTDYIVLPVLFKYHFGKQKHFYSLTGIYTSFSVNSKANGHNYRELYTLTKFGDTLSHTVSSSNPIKYYTKRVDMGFTLGGGYEKLISERISIGIDIRMNLGAINIPTNYSENGYIGFARTTKNINFETGIRIGYLWKKPDSVSLSQ